MDPKDRRERLQKMRAELERLQAEASALDEAVLAVLIGNARDEVLLLLRRLASR